ncbi:hypothetical protein [Mycobacterium sp. 852002-51057_SCH5723018]|uniref:hypothetical protein n=1 Tax=Mycobacterium sp. 852002-51057_SCH5723018 TaxID=1834094 RepID=UPI0007FB790E|nr:hypothetical protein [Mycobacterium sp. 852002-51057_SCH5723018]OBG26469.1 hypothetical protein A5764_05290 [Mycobacterium sp. 852002-51057_SCH5723018]
MIRPSIGDAIRELLFSHHRTVDDVMNAFFADDYEHRDNGKAYTRAEFASAAWAARANISHGTVITLDELRYWNRYAERHILEVTKVDGSVECTEVYVIGRYAIDGRFATLHEARLPLASPNETPSRPEPERRVAR